MRWSYIIPRVVLVVCIYGFFYLFFDRIVKFSIERSLEAIFDAKVGIKRVKTSFLRGLFVIEKMEVGSSKDEYRNLFEFDKLTFKLNVGELFKKRFIVEEASVTGLLFNGKRKTSAKIKKEPSQHLSSVDRYLDIAKDLLLERFDDIKRQGIEDIELYIKDLETIKLLDEIKNERIAKYQKVYSEMESLDIDERIRYFEKRVDGIKAEKNIIKQIKLASEVKKELDNFYKTTKERFNEVKRSLDEISGYITQIDEAKRNDINKIIQLAKIPSFDKERIALFLFGKDVYQRYHTYQFYLSKAMEFKRYIPENPKKRVFEEKRKRGRYIIYPAKDLYPRFLLVDAHIDGMVSPENQLRYTGSLKNLSSNPQLWKKPLILEVGGRKDNSKFQLYSSIDLSTSPAAGVIKVDWSGIKISDMVCGKDKLVFLINSALLDLNINGVFHGDEINIPVSVNFYNLRPSAVVNISSYKNINDVVKDTLLSLKGFKLDLLIKGGFREPKINIKSDISDIISKELERNFKKEFDVLKGKIEQRLDQEITKKKNEIEKILEDSRKRIFERLKDYQEKIEGLRERFERDIFKKLKL